MDIDKFKSFRKVADISSCSIDTVLLNTKFDITDEYNRSVISGYELGTKEPPLPILLKYARLIGISTDVLIDNELELKLHKRK